MPKEPLGVFVKDGREETAYTPAAVVQLRAQGWSPKQEPKKQAAKSKDEDAKDDNKSTHRGSRDE